MTVRDLIAEARRHPGALADAALAGAAFALVLITFPLLAWSLS